jgi:hypothetical protein
VVTPFVFKGTGQFEDAGSLTSTSGLIVMAGVGVMLIGVILATLAGLGRDGQLKKLDADSKGPPRTSGSITVGLFMAALAGVLSAGLVMSSVYSQAPIIANLSLVHPNSKIKVSVTKNKELSKEYAVDSSGNIQMAGIGAIKVGDLKAAPAAKLVAARLAADPKLPDPKVRIDTDNLPAVFSVTALGVIGGLLVNLGFAVYLLIRNKSWHVFFQSPRDFLLSATIAANSIIGIVVQNKGMLLLGALGASVGFGIQQAMQMTGCQGLGFISGEWRGVRGTPRIQMYIAIAVLMIAAGIMVIGRRMEGTP